VQFDPRRDQVRDQRVRRWADRGEVDQPVEGVQPGVEVARWKRGAPGQGVLAGKPLAGDAPYALADLAPALGIADADVFAPGLDMPGRGLAQAHAVERIGAPMTAHRFQPEFLRRAMFSA
jgi:hypothetical protein